MFVTDSTAVDGDCAITDALYLPLTVFLLARFWSSTEQKPLVWQNDSP